MPMNLFFPQDGKVRVGRSFPMNGAELLEYKYV